MVAPVSMAEQYNWKVGDLVPIGAQIYPMQDGSRTWEFEFAGTYEAGNDFSALLINYFYFDEARQFGRGSIGWMVIEVEDAEMVPDISTQIDRLYENSADPTRSAPEAEAFRAFMNQYGNIGLIMTGILSAVFFTILLLTANTMSQSFRERISELAVLKTVGFSDTKVAVCVLFEAVLLCLMPAVLSIACAIPVAAVIKIAVSSMPFSFPFELQVSTLYGVAGIALVLGLVVGAVPALTARRLTIVDALRT